MAATDERLVKVRINASGKRLVGCLRLPAQGGRTSDLLNGPEPFLVVLPDEYAILGKCKASHGVAKHAISYVEALEEPSGSAFQKPDGGRFVSVVAELHEPQTQVLAEVFVPEGQTVMDVLNDPRPFISMRNVHFSNFVERYGFLAVGKNQLVLLKG
ncbi:MAG: hypothetical protein P1P84_02175 [Deferrisomatales bacterium]|nr:hypothetical protein [Deferrisomatales bacterium]